MRFKQIVETTTAGSVATVAQPMMTQTRENTNVRGLKPVQQVMKGAKKKGPYANSIVESKVKELSMDLSELTDLDFKKKYGKTKAEVRASMKKEVNEEEIAEQDLIVIPGQGRLRRTGFVKHDLDQGEHEGHTLKNSLHTIARAASELDKRLSVQSEFPEWVSEKIGAAKGMMVSVMDYLISSQEMQHDSDAMQGVAEGYPKHQDLSGISTDKLKAYLAKQNQKQVPGEGNQVKRVRAELQRREERNFGNIDDEEENQWWIDYDMKEGSLEEVSQDTARSYAQKARASQKDLINQTHRKGADTDVLNKKIKNRQQGMDRAHTDKRYYKDEQGVAEGWKEKVAGATLGAAAIGGINALIDMAPPTHVNGVSYEMSWKVPKDAQVTVDDKGRKVHIWTVQGNGLRSRAARLKRYYHPDDDVDQVKEQDVAEGKIDFAKKLQKNVDKHNKAVVKTKKDIGSRVVDVGPSGKEHNEKTDAAWDAAKKKVSEGAKVDRMVKHVKQSEKKLGHSDKEAENIAWATANKRGMLDNKNKKK